MKETRGWDSKSANVIIHDDHSGWIWNPKWLTCFFQINVFGDILALGIGYAMTKTCFTHGLWWDNTRYLDISKYIKLFHNFDWINILIEIPGGSQFSGCFCLRYSACSLSETTLSLPQSRRSVVPLVVVVVFVVFVVAIDIFAFNQQNFVTSYYPQSSF